MRLNLTKEEIHTRGGMLDHMMDALPNPSILVDEKGIVLYASKQTQHIWEPEADKRLNTPVNSEDSRKTILEALKTGRSSQDRLVHIKGHKVLSNTIPIFEGDKVIGALCTITIHDMGFLKDIVAKLSETSGDKKLYHTLSRNMSKYSFDDFLGESPGAKKVIRQCRQAAKSDYSILIIGETGCGKEILAGAIHSERAGHSAKPFVKINCTAIPDNLIEAELFGYEKGAFTGASSARAGKFEQAGDGTILLDEIGDMNLTLQSKLLRVLEEREFERVGGDRIYPLQADIIATTNKDLADMCREKTFRMDLYYRLAMLEIHIPPLRERREDIPILLKHFMESYQVSFHLDREAMEYLCDYSWPGNVRQLKHLIVRLSILYPEETVTTEHLDEYFRINEEKRMSMTRMIKGNNKGVCDKRENSFPEEKEGEAGTRAGVPTLAEMEKEYIKKRLEANDGNVMKTAKELGVARNTLYSKIEKYGL